MGDANDEEARGEGGDAWADGPRPPRSAGRPQPLPTNRSKVIAVVVAAVVIVVTVVLCCVAISQLGKLFDVDPHFL